MTLSIFSRAIVKKTLNFFSSKALSGKTQSKENKAKALALLNKKPNRVSTQSFFEKNDSLYCDLKPNYGVGYYNSFNYSCKKSFFDNPQLNKDKLLSYQTIKRSKMEEEE